MAKLFLYYVQIPWMNAVLQHNNIASHTSKKLLQGPEPIRLTTLGPHFFFLSVTPGLKQFNHHHKKSFAADTRQSQLAEQHLPHCHNRVFRGLCQRRPRSVCADL